MNSQNVIDEEALRLYNAKEYMRHRLYAFMVQFPREEKLEILQIFINQVHNFLILDSKEIKHNSRICMIETSCSQTTIEDMLIHINKEEFDTLDAAAEESEEQYQYLLFCKEAGTTLLDELMKDIGMDGWAEYKFRVLRNYASEYKVADTYFYNRQQIIEMTHHGIINDDEIRIYENNERKPSADIVTTIGGIGDNFIVFSVIHEFARRKREMSREVYVMVADRNEQYGDGHDIFFYWEYPRVLFNNWEMNNLFKSRVASNLGDLNKSFAETPTPGHICSLTKKVLGIEDSFDPYTHKHILEEKLKNEISDEELQYIEQLTSKKNLVGFQYFTGQKVEDVFKVNHTRNWKPETVLSFVNICKQQGLDLLALNPNPYDIDLGIPQLRQMSTAAYAYTISKLALLVGIDSSAGHIASFYNIPSITIWGKQSPVNAFGKPISFRAMRKNFSLWSENLDINCITPELVIKKIRSYLNGTLQLSDHIISYEDSLNLYQMEIVKQNL